MNCPGCGRTMRHTQESWMNGGDCFVEWECPAAATGDCWEDRTIPAPEYNIIWYALDAAELRELKRRNPASDWLPLLQAEHDEARRRFPSAWRRYRCH